MQLEYRLNFLIDTILQPLLVSVIEMLIWSTIYVAMGSHLPGGFSKEAYVGYALWAAFVSRIAENWMYEYRLIEDIESGNVNAILVRPISFFEYYLFQFMGYKMMGLVTSIGIPIVVCAIWNYPLIWSRLPLFFLMVFTYLIFAFTMSFTVACLAFFFSRVHALTGAKNIALWVLSGLVFPLDLAPEPFRTWLIHLPFASGVFVPVGYLTGRLDFAAWLRGYTAIWEGLVVFGALATVLWHYGRKTYSGTGA